MIKPKIEKLIIKYITRSASASDLNTLSQWIKEPNNKQKFKDYVQMHYGITYNLNNPDSQKALEHLISSIRKKQSWLNKFKTDSFFKYAVAAAIVVGVLITSYFYNDNKFITPIEDTTPIIVKNQIVPGTDKAALTLENGESISLEKGSNYKTVNASSNGEEIVYSDLINKSDKLVFNTLTVPRGGQFFIKLSDETEVWLNSETQLKYPVNFIEGETRQVELVYGEAYFDVSPSTEHKGSRFKVFNQSQEVEVLGTEFNIKAYKDELKIFTTLVEGKVSVDGHGKKHYLVPNQQSVLNINNNVIDINKVNVYNEVSWKDGVFIFKNKSLNEIMKVLSRWYDTDFVFEDKEMANITFNGKLYKNQSIEEILNFININNYKINNKIIIFK